MKKIKAFTFIEILIISILITTWLLVVAGAITHAQRVNRRVMQSVIANQLATEWVEILYQQRNSNFLTYQKYKENVEIAQEDINACRLALNFDACLETEKSELAYNLSSCIDGIDNRILRAWYYYITNETWKNFINNCLCKDQETDCSDPKQDIYAICLNDWVWHPCPQWHEAWWDQSKYWKFYRIIEWIWSFDMAAESTGGQFLNTNRFLSRYAATDAQEYRFCSRVVREWGGWQDWELEICSTMTNFIN